MTDLPRTPAAEELFHLIFRHQRVPTYVGHGQRCTGCDHLKGETDGPNSPRHTQHLVDVIIAAGWVDQEQYRDQLKLVAVLETWKDEALEVMSGLEDLGKALDLPLGSSITGTLAAQTVERLKKSVGSLSAMLEAELAAEIESRVRDARGDVRCLDCNVRYGERQEYSCIDLGQVHTYSKGDLVGAEEIERSRSVEYVTLPVADLRAALAGPEGDEEAGR